MGDMENFFNAKSILMCSTTRPGVTETPGFLWIPSPTHFTETKKKSSITGFYCYRSQNLRQVASPYIYDWISLGGEYTEVFEGK